MTQKRKTIRELFLTLNKYSTKWDPYLDVYDRYFSKFRGNSPTMLEIGVADGGSMEMWLKYFENAKMYGLDIEPKWVAHKYPGYEDSVNLRLGNQADPGFWDSFIEDVPQLDIVLDDGGHEPQQQVVSLLKLFPRLKRGGIYIIEDVHTSYWAQWGGGFRNPDAIIETTKNLIDLINVQHIRDTTPPQEMLNIFHDLYSVSYYNSMIVLEKGIPRPFRTINTGKKDA